MNIIVYKALSTALLSGTFFITLLTISWSTKMIILFLINFLNEKISFEEKVYSFLLYVTVGCLFIAASVFMLEFLARVLHWYLRGGKLF